jgi:predicted ATPase/class 3 adenylate cyclase
MNQLPSGTVTFLFTDIEGSTRLLDELGAEGYAQALAEHRRRLREAFAQHGGVEVDTQGDAFFVAFPTAPEGLAAAAEAQASLAAGPIQVRMALHTGTPLVTEDGYVGVDVHRAARIAAAGHGTQVLVSATTAALIEKSGLRDLGEHRFKDLAAADRVYQLGDAEFPPLRSLYRTNLPVPATPFLGRERELAEVTNLLLHEDVRVLTLTGSGGTGKTRLAVQAAAAVADDYPDGITWVPLSGLVDPSLALTAVAQALELKEEPGRALADTLAAKLAGIHALFVLDNAEHLLPAVAGEVARLRDADGPTLLVTSRERLRLEGEHVWPVPPLDEDDGVALFTARARALDPSFTSTAEVDQLCARLDNLPLALELAAARTSLFSPAQLLERLAQRLDLLKGGREAEPRHLTLRATIAWSYELLDEDEQGLFRGLSAFPAGCSYEAAEAVCEAEPDTLQSLIDKSLVRRRDTEDGPRYWMLETIREYAAERLRAVGPEAETRKAHAEYFAALGDAVEDSFQHGRVEFEAISRISLELDNVRGALAFAVEGADRALQLRLARSLAMACAVLGRRSEAREALEDALAEGASEAASLRARALLHLGWTAFSQNDPERAEEAGEAALALNRAANDDLGVARALMVLGSVRLPKGDPKGARRLLAEASQIYRAHGHPSAVNVDVNLGVVALEEGNLDQAVELFQRSRDEARELGWSDDGTILCNLGLAALLASTPVEARAYYRAALAAASAFGAHELAWAALDGLAESWIACGQGVAEAVRIFAAAETSSGQLGFSMRFPGFEQELYEQSLATARQHLGEQRFAEEMEKGSHLTLDEATALARSIE